MKFMTFRSFCYLVVLAFTGSMLEANVLYPQRFPQVAARFDKDSVAIITARLEKIMLRHPWLQSLTQPSITENGGRRFIDMSSHKIGGYPDTFISDRQTIYKYPNGTKALFALISRATENYEDFIRRTHYEPANTIIEDKHGRVLGRYIFNELPLSYRVNHFEEYRFDLEEFLQEIESPLLNVAAGGTMLASAISKTTGHSLNAFSLDIAGFETLYLTNPFYLFADAKNTYLPDNTFGAIISFGGDLSNRKINYFDSRDMLAEMARIAKPQGKLLIEFSANEDAIDDLLDDAFYQADIPIDEVILYHRTHYNKYDAWTYTLAVITVGD